MAVIGLLWLPYALYSRDGAVSACHAFCRWVRLTLRLLCGLRTDVRGTVPVGEELIAPKHQSFLDIILIYGALPRAKFIMKAELRFAPILGWYALRIGCVPVNRGKRGAAITKMMRDVKSGQADPGPVSYTHLDVYKRQVQGLFRLRRGLYRRGGLKPGVAAVGTLHIAAGVGNDRRINLVFGIAVRADKTHVLALPDHFVFRVSRVVAMKPGFSKPLS